MYSKWRHSESVVARMKGVVFASGGRLMFRQPKVYQFPGLVTEGYRGWLRVSGCRGESQHERSACSRPSDGRDGGGDAR